MSAEIVLPFAGAIRDARKRGVSMWGLAAEVGVSPAMLKRIEDGARPVGWVARNLERALNLTTEERR